MNKLIDDSLGANRIVCHDVVDSLIRKYNSPAESIIRLVSLVDLDFMLGVAKLHANAEVKPGRASTYTYHFHNNSFTALSALIL